MLTEPELAAQARRCHVSVMTRDIVITAVQEGIPFLISMADGRQYPVRDRYEIAVRGTNAVVFDERSCPHILPLLTMTGITYLPKPDEIPR